MTPLLEDPSVKEIDVVAIQEPFRNLINDTTYNPSSSRFHLAYSSDLEARTYFYINKRIETDSQGIIYRGSDLCSLQINIRKRIELEETATSTRDLYQKTIQIYNIYNPSLVSYSSTDSLSTIPQLEEALGEDREYIIVGDFNLYYP